jgi:hypothetical protein
LRFIVRDAKGRIEAAFQNENHAKAWMMQRTKAMRSV